MTREKQRIAIATACGFTDIMLPTGFHQKMSDEKSKECGGSWRFQIPDYLTDLNAMHEAEKVLTEKGVNAWWTYVGFIHRHNPTPFGTETAVHATAAQRAEAFLRALGLWEEAL